MEDLTPSPQKEPKGEAEDDAMEIDETRQQTPTQPTLEAETPPTKPEEESEVEELVNFPSAGGSEAGDQEMEDATLIREEETEKEGTAEEAAKDKEEKEEEDAPVATRLRRPKPKEKVEIEVTSPKTRKGHKKGERCHFSVYRGIYSLRSTLPNVPHISSRHPWPSRHRCTKTGYASYHRHRRSRW
jgi:hypothetical protein